MIFKEKRFQKIWNKALMYQDKRNDKGHAKVATLYTLELLSLMPKANKYVVMPAIILHDIGWSQISQKDRLVSYFKAGTKEEYFFRLLHQCYGVGLASEILNKTFYPSKFTGEILTIVSQHDTRRKFFNLNDAIVRDADKLWRYSREHFLAAVNNCHYNSVQTKKFLEFLAKQISKKEFFLTKKAKWLARRDFKKLITFIENNKR